jgi:hypothetical protein
MATSRGVARLGSRLRQGLSAPVHLPGRLALCLAGAAVCLELLVSANLLTWAGIPYVTDGGNFLLIFHPGTMLLAAAAACAFARGWGAWLQSLPAELLVFFTALSTCIISIVLLTGPGNLIVLLDTFMPAGLLAVVLAYARPATILRLRRVMQILLAGNACLALLEMAAQSTLVPLYLNDAAYHPLVEDFRPTALFDHPLTGSVMMMMGLAIAPRGRVGVAYRLLLWAALIAFGGRTALGVTVAAMGLRWAFAQAKLVAARDPNALPGMLLAAGGILAAGILGGIAIWAGLGDRLVGHLYWDSSAQVRVAQWQILDRLEPAQWLFGTPRDVLLGDLNALRLDSGVEVIENFWLLMFVSLGAVGFPVFLAMLGALCLWCWRRTEADGRILLVSILLVASTSNSLGRKSTILVCLVATMCCLPAKARRMRVARRQTLACLPVLGALHA